LDPVLWAKSLAGKITCLLAVVVVAVAVAVAVVVCICTYTQILRVTIHFFPLLLNKKKTINNRSSL
jgi:flagellar biosynthesis protein FliQ